MSEMSKGEKQAINAAWSALMDRASVWNWTAEGMLNSACASLRRERAGTNALHIARSLVVASTHDGYHDPAFAAARLYGRAEGCIIATVVGAGMRQRDDELRVAREVSADAYSADDIWSPALEHAIGRMVEARPYLSKADTPDTKRYQERTAPKGRAK